MAAGSTYTPIATTTLTSSASSVTFSSISGSYTDIVLVGIAKSTTTSHTPRLRFNSDTGTNYSLTYLKGNGSAAASNRNTNVSGIYLSNFDGDITEFSPFIANVQNYSNSTTYKTVLSRGANVASGGDVSAVVGLWRNTNAITTMVLEIDSGGSWASGSTFTLYGITAA